MTPRRPDLVRYVSPFGSPATMSRERARALLDEDDRRWVRYQEAGLLDVMVSPSARAEGPPRIENLPR